MTYTVGVERPGFEEVEHTADWALRVRGLDLADLCRRAAAGMMQLAGVEVGNDPSSDWDVHLTAPDAESLLVSWLEEVLFEMETRQRAPREMRLRTQGETHLVGTVTLGPLLHLGKAIKAVTYHDLRIRRDSSGCEATIVFDV